MFQGNRLAAVPGPLEVPWALWEWDWCSVTKAGSGFYLDIAKLKDSFFFKSEIAACLLCKEMW